MRLGVSNWLHLEETPLYDYPLGNQPRTQIGTAKCWYSLNDRWACATPIEAGFPEVGEHQLFRFVASNDNEGDCYEVRPVGDPAGHYWEVKGQGKYHLEDEALEVYGALDEWLRDMACYDPDEGDCPEDIVPIYLSVEVKEKP